MPGENRLSKLEGKSFDVLIVGAGINGAVCGAALSAQGVKVCLIDQGDFGGQTSQESSNLVWGGIYFIELFNRLSSHPEGKHWVDRWKQDVSQIFDLILRGQYENGSWARKYPTGRKVTDEEMRRMNLKRHKFHGEWNYTIRPRSP